MNTILLIIGIGILAGIIFLIYKLNEFQKPDDKNAVSFEHIESLRTELREHGARLDDRLHKSLQHSSAQSASIIKEVTEKLTVLTETNKQVKDFASQMQSLENILKNPKQRGILGEYYLETLLKNVLPPGSYQMQYPFPDGTIVDAVVFVKDKIIPIDSKFSLENYNRIVEEKNEAEKDKLEKLFVADLKMRITETAKYIQPSQGTMDFAFMFIPHEAIYYDLVINKIGALKEDTETFIQRAASKHHVLIVSPTSFLAYLQTVLQGLNALHIEEKAVEIIKRVGELGRHITAYETYMERVGGNLSTTVNSYNAAYKELKKIDKDVYRITDGDEGGKINPLLVDKVPVDN
ncbi:MAG: DNA recombination protein RmuC [Candidatus Gracilibacteria bacterium]